MAETYKSLSGGMSRLLKESLPTWDEELKKAVFLKPPKIVELGSLGDREAKEIQKEIDRVLEHPDYKNNSEAYADYLKRLAEAKKLSEINYGK